jgi:hypothetical protein
MVVAFVKSIMIRAKEIGAKDKSFRWLLCNIKWPKSQPTTGNRRILDGGQAG